MADESDYMKIAGIAVRRIHLDILVLVLVGVIGGLVMRFTDNTWLGVGIVAIFLFTCKFFLDLITVDEDE
jgi:hypothetical protein